VIYASAVAAAQGAEGVAKRFRLRWTENAEHIPPMMIPSSGPRATNTWLVDYGPVIEQSMVDLIDWVERGVEPAGTNFTFRDGRVTLPTTAAERGGTQPVVHVTVDGALRTEVAIGADVTFTVTAEMPPGAGSIIAVEWDFDGHGTYPMRHDDIDGTQTSLTRTVTHRFDQPGTWFVTALVHGHRDGDTTASFRRVPNLGQVRVVVA
jgi:hypothetical protein